MSIFNLSDFLAIFILTVMGAAAQLALKKSTLNKHSNYLYLFIDPWFIAGGLLLTIETFCIVILLKRLPLIYVAPMLSLIYILVPLGAVCFFHEKVNNFFWLGTLCLISGVLCITLS